MGTIRFITLGCKVNSYETQAMTELFEQHGYTLTGDVSADVTVINSCTVTSTGDKKVRHTISRAKRDNPEGVVVLTGCFASAYPDKAELLGADIVSGVRDRAKLPSLVAAFKSGGERIVHIPPHEKDELFEELSVSRFDSRTRAVVKIEDGCDRFCAYCIVPFARGPVRSKSLSSIAEEVKRLSDCGCREVVLSGVNLSCYGQDIGAGLADAVETAARMDGIERIRLGSLEPDLVDEDMLVRLSRIKKLCPHFHLSLQSGCDRTLKAMNRRYDTDYYATLVGRVREMFPGVGITTDLMAGFPGETEEDFLMSMAFAERIRFSRVHVFPFSRREGTKAADMPGQVGKAVCLERAARLTSLCEEHEREFTKEHGYGNVLIEGYEDGAYVGYTENYARVRIESATNIKGHIVPYLREK